MATHGRIVKRFPKAVKPDIDIERNVDAQAHDEESLAALNHARRIRRRRMKAPDFASKRMRFSKIENPYPIVFKREIKANRQILHEKDDYPRSKGMPKVARKSTTRVSTARCAAGCAMVAWMPSLRVR
jgi:hypothetical protein